MGMCLYKYNVALTVSFVSDDIYIIIITIIIVYYYIVKKLYLYYNLQTVYKATLIRVIFSATFN